MGVFVGKRQPMNKKPPELHLIEGTKSRRIDAAMIPSSIKKRVPKAEWLDAPESFDKSRFIEETAEFLHEVYGIGSDQDKHTLAMLADQIEVYCRCSVQLRDKSLVVPFNDGKTFGTNPFLSLRNKTTTLIIQLMNELGLTPRGRLASNKTGDDSPVAKFLKGPKG